MSNRSRRVVEHCETVITPDGVMIECINPDTRMITLITQETLSQDDSLIRRHKNAIRILRDRAVVEAGGFMLAWERPL